MFILDFKYDDTGENKNTVSLEEFCDLFHKIHENSQNPKNIFIESFSYIDTDK
jgi:hypothetical protein